MTEPFELLFWVEGEPRAKQSFRVGNGGGYQPARVKSWQSAVGYAGQQAMRRAGYMEPVDGNMTVEIIFFLGDLRRIDLDNLSKAVQDGLNQVVWHDDQSNIRLVLDKYVCRTKQGVSVKVTANDRVLEIDEEDLPVIAFMEIV